MWITLRIFAAMGVLAGGYVFFQNVGRLEDHDAHRLALVVGAAVADTACLTVLFWKRDASAFKRKKLAQQRLAKARAEDAQASHVA